MYSAFYSVLMHASSDPQGQCHDITGEWWLQFGKYHRRWSENRGLSWVWNVCPASLVKAQRTSWIEGSPGLWPEMWQGRLSNSEVSKTSSQLWPRSCVLQEEFHFFFFWLIRLLQLHQEWLRGAGSCLSASFPHLLHLWILGWGAGVLEEPFEIQMYLRRSLFNL